nr:MAG TPA: hypothetical protein [Caudoviricetes sp.]
MFEVAVYENIKKAIFLEVKNYNELITVIDVFLRNKYIVEIRKINENKGE